MHAETEIVGPVLPRLSVIITCYNYEQFVARAIESVLSQISDGCELLVVDDGSTDGSWQAILHTGANAIQTANQGARRACISGLERTSAPFVLFLDADDELRPGALDRIFSLLDDRVAKLQFPLMPIDAEGRPTGKPFPPLKDGRLRQPLIKEVLTTGCYTSPPTSGNVFRRDVAQHIVEAEYDRFVDGVILFLAPFLGEVVSVSEPLANYRIHDRNDSGIGQNAQPSLLRRDLDRYAARMHHLRQVLNRIDPRLALVAPQREWFYLERSFCLAIASGSRPDIMNAVRLVPLILRGNRPVRAKSGLMLFVIFGMILPNRYAKRVLDYRLKSGKRSAKGLLQAIWSA